MLYTPACLEDPTVKPFDWCAPKFGRWADGTLCAEFLSSLEVSNHPLADQGSNWHSPLFPGFIFICDFQNFGFFLWHGFPLYTCLLILFTCFTDINSLLSIRSSKLINENIVKLVVFCPFTLCSRYSFCAVRTGIIENLARTLELPFLVGSIVLAEG